MRLPAPFWLIACLLPVGGCKKPAEPEKAKTESPAPAASPLGSAAEPKPEAPAPAPVELGALNVILITIDSLRAEMPWTGYARPIAPNLTKLAERSVVYTRAYSASSYTAKSVATLLTSRYPSTLYRDGFFFTKYPKSNLFLAEVLTERGLPTIGFHAHLYFGRGKGLEQGFSEWELVPGITFDPQTDKHVTSDKLTELGKKLLSAEKNTGKQFFAWAHYMDPHDEYIKHRESPDFGNKGRDKYDSEVWFTDQQVGHLFSWGETQPFWKNTAIIISADHGEAFGEHGMYKHAFELWEVLTRVPLVIYFPGVVPRRIDLRRSHIDLAPTILDLMKVPVPDTFEGKSLLPELRGGEPASHEPILTELSEDSHNPYRRALIEGDLKIIDFGRSRFELYDLAKDPGELENLASTRKEDLALMKQKLVTSWSTRTTLAPYGGMKLRDGASANGPVGPPSKP